MICVLLTLELEQGLSWPEFYFNVEPESVVESLTGTGKKQVVVKLNVVDKLSMVYYNKTPQQTIVDQHGTITQDQTLAIQNVYFDDFLLDPKVINLMSHYTPKYNQGFIDYCQQHNIHVDHNPQHQLKFWHNGTWQLDWDQDFWTQYQQQRRSIYSTENLNYSGYTFSDINDQLLHLKALLES